MAATLLQEVSKDERERALFRSRMMFETDRVSDLLTAEARGEIKGMEKGREEGRKYFLELLDQGITIEEIKQRLNKTS